MTIGKGNENPIPDICLILADEEGNPTLGAEELIYRLEGKLEILDQIEQATEKFKRQAYIRDRAPFAPKSPAASRR